MPYKFVWWWWVGVGWVLTVNLVISVGFGQAEQQNIDNQDILHIPMLPMCNDSPGCDLIVRHTTPSE